MNLRVVEIFESLQGEGFNAGTLAIFIRLAGCNKNCSFCDTNWITGKEMTVNEIISEIKKFKSNIIIWTGGEPTIQLNKEVLNNFKDYYNCLETNGTNKIPYGINYVSCSPKVDLKTLSENFPLGVDEIRLPVGKNTKIPSIEELPMARNYYLSPMFQGEKNKKMLFSGVNFNKCLTEIKKDKRWKLSVQLHKILKIQ